MSFLDQLNAWLADPNRWSWTDKATPTMISVGLGVAVWMPARMK